MGTLPTLAHGDGVGNPPTRTLIGDGDGDDDFRKGDKVRVVATPLREWFGREGVVTGVVDRVNGFGDEWFRVESDDMALFSHFQSHELELVERGAQVVDAQGPQAPVSPTVYGEDLTVADILGADDECLCTWQDKILSAAVEFADALTSAIEDALDEDWEDADEA